MHKNLQVAVLVEQPPSGPRACPCPRPKKLPVAVHKARDGTRHLGCASRLHHPGHFHRNKAAYEQVHGKSLESSMLCEGSTEITSQILRQKFRLLCQDSHKERFLCRPTGNEAVFWLQGALPYSTRCWVQVAVRSEEPYKLQGYTILKSLSAPDYISDPDATGELLWA